MSGDCTKQPIIFYSEEMTETKIFLLQQHGIKFKKYEYFISEDQIYLYKKDKWLAMPNTTLVKPIKSKDKFSFNKEEELIGIVILGNLFVCLMSWRHGHSFFWWKD